MLSFFQHVAGFHLVLAFFLFSCESILSFSTAFCDDLKPSVSFLTCAGLKSSDELESASLDESESEEEELIKAFDLGAGIVCFRFSKKNSVLNFNWLHVETPCAYSQGSKPGCPYFAGCF